MIIIADLILVITKLNTRRKTMDKIAVLIPCYNESKTIKKVILDWKEALPDAVIYVYDNNSTDETDKIAKIAGAVVRYESMQGKGNVIRRMFREIDAECYIMVDGDDTYPAQAGPFMVNKVLNDNVDMVIGDRLSSTYFVENKRPFHNLGNSMTRYFINKIFKSDIKDIMTGLRAFSFRFVKTFPVLSHGFEIETEMTIHAVDKKMSVCNHIIEYRDRPEGSVSKLNTISDGAKVLRTIFTLFKYYRPFKFFSIISFILSTFSIGFFIPIFIDFLKTGLVLKVPTLIVCCFALIAALVFFASGLILDTITHKERQSFEYRLQLTEHFMINKCGEENVYEKQI